RLAGEHLSPPAGGGSFPWQTFLLSFLILVVPTMLMGATFPVLGRALAADRENVAGRIGQLYGWNTGGAELGTLLCAYQFLPALGLAGTTRLAAGLNLLLACAALLLAWRSRGAPAAATRPPSREPASGTPHGAALFSMAALIGCVTVALQILGNRLLISLLGGSVYAFASVLAIFLLGIAGGGLLGGGFLAARKRPLSALAHCCFLLAGAIGLGLLLLRMKVGPGDPLQGPRNLGLLSPGASMLDFLLAATSLAALTFLPATLLSGAIFPAVTRWFQASPGPLARRLGLLYGLNTLGSVVGSVMAVVVLLPLFGLRWSLLSLGLLSLLAGLLPLLAGRKAGEQPPPALLAASLLFSLALLAGGLYPGQPDGAALGEREIFYAESPASSVQVIEVEERGEPMPVRCLFVNGKAVATSMFIDQRLQLLLGFIPTLLHEDPRRIVSIALGTGMSSGALALSGAESLEIVELSSGVIAAAPLFDRWTGAVLDRPNVQLHCDDGRAFLQRSQKQYDLISADPIHPWVAGSANLFTAEYYRLARARLADGGMMSQWIPLYELTTEDIAGIVRTFSEVFPEVSAWVTGYDMVLLGSLEPLAIDLQRIRSRVSREPVRSLLRGVGVPDAESLLGCYFAGRESLQELAGRASRTITDDQPWIEFTAPRSALMSGYATEVLTLLALSGDRLPLRPGADPAVRAQIEAANLALREAALRFVEAIQTTGRLGAARNAYSAELRGE
ncbi:MAG: fused MFS/spermidine synthase, partial [Planctomycetota bacterium]